MELDKLKTTWSQSNNTENHLKPENIKSMLRNKSNGTLNNVKHLEKTSIWLGIVSLPFFWGLLFFDGYYLHNGFDSKYLWIGIIFTVFLIYSSISQLCKLKYLKKTDMLNMDILTVSLRMAKYKRFAFYETVITLIISIPLIALMLWILLGSNEPIYVYLIFAAFLLCLTAGTIWVYRELYYKKLQAIQKALKEIKEFEEEE